MSPSTRSSLAPTTPQKGSNSSASPSPEGRKVPHCQICKKPRKGHPRQGCPNQLPADGGRDTPALASAMGSLHIESDPKPDVVSAPSAIQDSLAKAKLRQTRGSLMPGTYYPPTNSFLDTEPPSLPSSQRTEIVHYDDEPEEGSKPLSQTTSLASQPSVAASRSLVRTASMDAREEFLEDLDRVAKRVPVSVYIVPTDDIERLERSASKVGFRTATVLPENVAYKDEALLVIGTEDNAVSNVRERLVKETSTRRSARPSYGLAQVAGGAMVGAAAVFAGLTM